MSTAYKTGDRIQCVPGLDPFDQEPHGTVTVRGGKAWIQEDAKSDEPGKVFEILEQSYMLEEWEGHRCPGVNDDSIMCIDGVIYGPCDYTECGNACESYYTCDCTCHRKGKQ